MNTRQAIAKHFRTPPHRRQALRILMHINVVGKCFQAFQTIANFTGIHESRIETTISKLIQAKLVQYEYLNNGRKSFFCHKNHRPFMVRNLDLLHLPPTTFLVANAIEGAHGRPISIPNLARKCFCSERQVRRATTELTKIGFIKIQKNSRSYFPNSYIIQSSFLASIGGGQITSLAPDVRKDVRKDVSESPPPAIKYPPPSGINRELTDNERAQNAKKGKKRQAEADAQPDVDDSTFHPSGPPPSPRSNSARPPSARDARKQSPKPPRKPLEPSGSKNTAPKPSSASPGGKKPPAINDDTQFREEFYELMNKLKPPARDKGFEMGRKLGKSATRKKMVVIFRQLLAEQENDCKPNSRNAN